MTAFYTILAVLILIFDVYAVYTLWATKLCKTAPTVPSHGKGRMEVLKQADAYLKTGKIKEVADMGAGFGGLIAPLAQKYGKVKFTGYEWDRMFSLFLKLRFVKRKNVEIVRTDFMKEKITAGLITAFLNTNEMKTLEEKIKKEKWKNKILIVNYFPLPAVKPDKVIDATGLVKWQVYIYRF